MLSAKSIEQELQRIEAKLDMLLGQINKLEERMNAERIASTATANARYSPRNEAQRWERAFTQGR